MTRESEERGGGADARSEPVGSEAPPRWKRRPFDRTRRWFASLVPGRWIEEDERKAEAYRIRLDFARTVAIGLVVVTGAVLFDLPNALMEVNDRRQRAASKVTPEFEVLVHEICPREGGARFEVAVNVRVKNEGSQRIAVRRVGLAVELLGVPRSQEETSTIALPVEPLHGMWVRGERSRPEFAEFRCDPLFLGADRKVHVDCRRWLPDSSGACVVEYRHCRDRDLSTDARYLRDESFSDTARYIVGVPEADFDDYLYFSDVAVVIEWCEIRMGILGWRAPSITCTSDPGGGDHWSLRTIAPLHELANYDAQFCRGAKEVAK